MNKEQFLIKYKGKTAEIIGVHPHTGCTAECIGSDKTLAGLGVKFKRLDTSEEFYVFDGKNVRWN